MQVLIITYPAKRRVVGVVEYNEDISLTDVREFAAQLLKEEYPEDMKLIKYDFHSNLGWVEKRFTTTEKYTITLVGGSGRITLKAVIKDLKKFL